MSTSNIIAIYDNTDREAVIARIKDHPEWTRFNDPGDTGAYEGADYFIDAIRGGIFGQYTAYTDAEWQEEVRLSEDFVDDYSCLGAFNRVLDQVTAELNDAAN